MCSVDIGHAGSRDDSYIKESGHYIMVWFVIVMCVLYKRNRRYWDCTHTKWQLLSRNNNTFASKIYLLLNIASNCAITKSIRLLFFWKHSLIGNLFMQSPEMYLWKPNVCQNNNHIVRTSSRLRFLVKTNSYFNW